MPTLLEQLILPATVLEQAKWRLEGQHSVAKFNGNLEALPGLQLAINILAGMAQDAALDQVAKTWVRHEHRIVSLVLHTRLHPLTPSPAN